MSPVPRPGTVAGGRLPWSDTPRRAPARDERRPATLDELRALVPCLGCGRTPGARGRTVHRAGCAVAAAEEVARRAARRT